MIRSIYRNQSSSRTNPRTQSHRSSELFRYQLERSPSSFDRNVSLNPTLDRRVYPKNAISHFVNYDESTTRAARRKIARDHDVKRNTILQKKSKQFTHRLLGVGPPCVEPKPILPECNLEVLDEPPVTYKGLQSEWFPEPLVEPIFIPEQIYADDETQIYDGDLFDFDLEVDPYIEVLVGRIVQQAMFETVYQDELYLNSADRATYYAKRASDKVELQRLVEQERRLRTEKEGRKEQFLEACRLQKEIEERVAAVVHVKHDFGILLPNVLEGLRETGYLLEDIKDNIDQGVTPYLWNEMNRSSDVKRVSRDILTEMVRDITETRDVLYPILGEMEDEIPKLRPTTELLVDSSDDEGEGILGDHEEWNIVEYEKKEEEEVEKISSSLVCFAEVIERIRKYSLVSGTDLSEFEIPQEILDMVEEKDPSISWMKIIKSKDYWMKELKDSSHKKFE